MLTEKEIKQLVTILEKVRLPAPYPVFIALLKSVPMIAVDLAVMPDKDHILLTYRDDEFYKGWHIPGSILRYSETTKDAWRRVVTEELGMNIRSAMFKTYFNYQDHRESGITLLFVAKPKGKLKDGVYFALNKLPKDFLKAQQFEINYLKKNL